jgi:hypothetical protein
MLRWVVVGCSTNEGALACPCVDSDLRLGLLNASSCSCHSRDRNGDARLYPAAELSQILSTPEQSAPGGTNYSGTDSRVATPSAS